MGAEEEEAAFVDKGEAEANPCGEEGGEAGGAVLEVGELDIFLVWRWAAEGFLGPWPAEARLLGATSLGPGAGAVAARRLWRFWLR